MAFCRLDPPTLHPPALSAADDAAAEENLPWVLLELQAYVAKRDNATTAASTTWDGKRVQVTFCPRRPPRVSYVCVHSPDAAEIRIAPKILAVEDGLALLRITVGPDIHYSNIDYYVYQAGGGTGRRPSLTHLPRPPRRYFFDAQDIGVLRYRTAGEGEHAGGGEYIVAGLFRVLAAPAGQFDLCLYDSKRGDWKVYGVSLSKEQRRRHGGKNFYHKCCKVMAIGGDAGTMAFVDLWRGILFCDVLPVEAEAEAWRRTRGSSEPLPLLRYVRLPEPMQSNKTLEGDAHLCRDIAVVGDRLKYVELQLHYFKARDGVVFGPEGNSYFSDGWMAATWSRPVIITSSATPTSDDDGRWRQDTKIMDSRNVKIRSELVLPKVWSRYDEGMARSPFRKLDACQPVLSLQEDEDIVYFTTKLHRWDDDAWVVAVDMGKKELLGVVPFAAQRYLGINFSYVHARISKHLMKS